MTNDTNISGETFSAIKDRRKKEVYTGNSKPLSFKDLFGDHTEKNFFGTLNLEGLNLNSLTGAPSEVVNGGVLLADNPELTVFSPIILGGSMVGSFNMTVDTCLLFSILDFYKGQAAHRTPNIICNCLDPELDKLEDLIIEIVLGYFQDCKIENTQLLNIEFIYLDKEVLKLIYLISTYSDSKIVSLYSLADFKKFNDLYSKVGFDKEKLKRAAKLL